MKSTWKRTPLTDDISVLISHLTWGELCKIWNEHGYVDVWWCIWRVSPSADVFALSDGLPACLVCWDASLCINEYIKYLPRCFHSASSRAPIPNVAVSQDNLGLQGDYTFHHYAIVLYFWGYKKCGGCLFVCVRVFVCVCMCVCTMYGMCLQMESEQMDSQKGSQTQHACTQTYRATHNQRQTLLVHVQNM